MVATCSELFKWITTRKIDLIVLDVMLPDGSGLDMCRSLPAKACLLVVVDQPAQHNAIDDALHDLGHVFYDVQTDPDSDVVILTGTERWFCAGGDMTCFRSASTTPRNGGAT